MKILNETLNEKYFTEFILYDDYLVLALRLYPHLRLRPRPRLHIRPRLRLHLCLYSENGEVVRILTNPQSHSLAVAIINDIDLYETIGELQ